MHEITTRRRGATPTDTPTIESIMARIVAGDRAAVFTLREFYSARMVGQIRNQLRACGVYDISRDDLDGLVTDVCTEIVDAASGWKPGGASPWWWARNRVNSVIARHIGIHADNIDDRVHEAAAMTPVHAACSEPSIAESFARLIRSQPHVSLLAEAALLARVSDDTLFVLLDYQVQQDQGDRSPAATLAPRYGKREDALRQQVSRARRRLRQVVADEPRFAPLADMALVA